MTVAEANSFAQISPIALLPRGVEEVEREYACDIETCLFFLYQKLKENGSTSSTHGEEPQWSIHEIETYI